MTMGWVLGSIYDILHVTHVSPDDESLGVQRPFSHFEIFIKKKVCNSLLDAKCFVTKGVTLPCVLKVIIIMGNMFFCILPDVTQVQDS